jgi:hypothetical protein
MPGRPNSLLDRADVDEQYVRFLVFVQLPVLLASNPRAAPIAAPVVAKAQMQGVPA